MAKTVADLVKNVQRNDMNNPKNQNQNDPTMDPLKEAQAKIAFLEAQQRVLNEQLLQRSKDSEEARLMQEAEQMRKEEATLREEANLQKILNEALATESKRKPADENETLSSNDLANIMAETVSKALDANTKLTMREVEKKLAESTKQQAAMQDVLIKLLGGLSVDQAKKKFPDFDQYSEEAARIHASHPSLSPEQAYILAKGSKAISQPGSDKVSSERPTDVPFAQGSRESGSSEENPVDETINPRLKFQRAISDAIDKVVARH